MKIFLDCTFLRNKLTGVDVTFLSLINEISTLDKENLYSIYIDSRFNETILKENLNNNKNFKIKKLYSPLPLQILYSSFIFPLILLIGKFDVYHNPYFFGPIFKFFNKKTKIIITVHDLYYITIPNYVNKKIKFAFKLFAERAIKKADNLIAISSQTKKDLIEYLKIDEAKIKLIYQSFNSVFSKIEKDDEFIKKNKFENKIIMLNVGKLLPSKGFIDIIEALFELKKEDNLSQNLILVNTGILSDKNYYNKVLHLVDIYDLSNQIKILGYTSNEELKSLYNHCKVVIISSYNEGFGLPALEAFYFNKELIYREIPSLSEVADDAGYPFSNKKDLKNQIIKILNNDNIEKNKLLTKGKNRLSLFSWENSAKKYLESYKNL
jgi:glycosyltransferase involved in cell wall biosynthesis